MTAGTPRADLETRRQRQRLIVSRCAGGLAVAMVAATLLLMSPRAGENYPGLSPWTPHSLLRPLVGLLSLGGLVQTARGVEIKDLALHAAAAIGLLLVAARALLARSGVEWRQALREPWLVAQLCLGAWVALSLASVTWSGDPPLTAGQAGLYALAFVWAVALGWTLDRRDIPWVLGAITALSAATGALTIWYFLERSPHHRPGFPLGNPNMLAAVLLPGILMAGHTVVHRALPHLRARRWPRDAWLWASVGALVPLLVAFWLAGALAAKVGLLAGVTGLVFVQLGRRSRWLVVGLGVVIAIGAVGYRFAGGDHFDMARGESARLRLYTWRYAAILWQQHPLLGVAAGSYTRLANGLSTEDMLLDPAVFMAPLRGHAHNELFQVLAEIGLIGGVAFVAGHLASLAAGLLAARRHAPRRQRALLLAATAGLLALYVDALGSVSFRHPGVPALAFTLLGVLWATGRAAARGDSVGAAIARIVDPGGVRRRGRLPRLAAAGAATLAAVAAVWLAGVNWRGVQHERAAYDAYDAGQYLESATASEAAAARLLDPVRRLAAARDAVDAGYRHTLALLETGVSPPDGALLAMLLTQLQRVYEAAAALDARAPNYGDMPTYGARCAERLAELLAPTAPLEAQQWRVRAARAWSVQRQYNRYHVEALLALLQYPGPLREHLVLLRDALRQGTPDDPRWRAALLRLAGAPGFEAALEQLGRAAGPLDPATEADALMVSMAPEAYRLVAAWQAERGDCASAATLTARAVVLYEALRARLPRLPSRALAEQAEYALRAAPDDAATAVALADQALAALPVIQRQQRARLAQPLRVLRTRCLLAAGREPEARDELRTLADELAGDEAAALRRDADAVVADLYVGLARMFITQRGPRRAPVGVWLTRALELRPAHVDAWRWGAWLAAETGRVENVERVLADAAAAGVAADELTRVRQRLAESFPTLRTALEPRE